MMSEKVEDTPKVILTDLLKLVIHIPNSDLRRFLMLTGAMYCYASIA